MLTFQKSLRFPTALESLVGVAAALSTPVFLLATAVACTTDSPEEAKDPMANEERAARPALSLEGPVHHLDRLAREPMVVQHPDGSIFLAGYPSQVTGQDPGSVPQLWRSQDGGDRWQRVEVGSAEEGATGNSDVDLAVSSSGVLYLVAMGFDRSTGEGTHISIGTSHDVGTSWLWHRLSQTRLDDRPWVEVDPDGLVHVVWNDGEGVSHAVSSDEGRSWQERGRIHARGGSSHLAIGPQGQLAVRITPLSGSGNVFDEGLELVAVSGDGGETWSEHAVPGERDWDPTFQDQNKVPRWVEPLAFTEDGTLWHLFSSGTDIELLRSSDLGESWQVERIASHDDVAYFPYLTSHGSELAAVWFSGTGEGLVANLARIETDTGTNAVSVRRSPPFAIDAWNETDSQAVRTTGGEYLPVVFLADGSLGVAAPIQDAAHDRWGFSFWRAR